MLFDFSIDLENELTRIVGAYNIIIPKPIVKELEYLSMYGKGEKKIKAKASLKIIKKYHTFDVSDKKGDDAVLDLAKKMNAIVVTNDIELKNRLKEKSISVIFLRAKKKLVME